MSESGQDGQNEDFFGDFHAANVNTVPQNNDTTTTVENTGSNELMTKVEDSVPQPEVQNKEDQSITGTADNSPSANTTSADFFNLDFSATNTQPTGSNHAEFSEIKFPNGSLPAASDLLDIDFSSLPVEPTPPTPGTPSIEVHFVTSDQTSEVSNETKSDTDSNAPTDSWSVSTQYPESRADMESVKDDAKSEQSLDDKSQQAEDGSDAFDFPTPKESGDSEQKDEAPVTNMTDSTEFEFPASTAQPEQSTPEVSKPHETNGTEVLLTPVQSSEDKPSEVQDETISVSSDTVPANSTNDFNFDDEFKSAAVVSDDSNNGSEGKTGNSSLEQSANEERDKDQTVTDQDNVPKDTTTEQPSDDFFGSTPVAPKETTATASTSTDFGFPAPSSDPQPQQVEQDKSGDTNDATVETPVTSANTNDFTFDTEFTSAATSEVKQPEEAKPVDEPSQVKSDNDFEFEGEVTSPSPPTVEEKQPEAEQNKSSEASSVEVEAEANKEKTQPEEKSSNDFEFEGEFASAPSVPVVASNDETTPTQPAEEKKNDNDFEFEGEFTSASSVPVAANNNDTAPSAEEKKSDDDFEFEGEFTAAPTPSAPITATNTNANQEDDDDFFDSDFQAAPTVPQVPQEQPQAPKSGGTFEADFDEDFEDFAQAPTTQQPQPPVQPPQPVSAQTTWLFEGNETDVRDRVQTLVSTLFPAPAPSKVLPDINTTVEEKLEELRSSAPAVDAQSVPLPAPSVFAEHLKTMLASVGPTTPVPGLQPARARSKRSPFDTHLSKKEILTLLKKETSAVLHVSPRPTLPSARGGKKRKNSATPSPNATPSAAKQPVSQPKTATPPQPKLGVLPPTPQQPKTSPTPVKANVQVPAPADNRPKPNETPEEKSNRIVNELVQSVPDLSFMLLEEFRPSVNVM